MKLKYPILLILIIFYACEHDLESPKWDVDTIFPIFHTELNIKDINKVDSNINVDENAEGLISLSYKKNFTTINLDTLIKIDEIADEQTHTLSEASFEDINISDSSTIGEAILEIPGGSFLIPDGSITNIPALQNIASNDTINIDASEYFQTMTLHEGMLIVEIFNGYPTNVSNINISLLNSINQNIIGVFNFPTIQSNQSVSDSIFIGGQTIDENLLAILNNMDIDASNGPVLIDYNDAIVTNITLSNIGITEATAIFPEQQLTETLKEHTFNLQNVQLKEVGIKSGTVTVNVLSTLPNGKMIYNIPSLSKNGISFTTNEMLIPEATNNNLTSFIFNFDGYVLDLTGKEGRLNGDTINTIYTEAYTFIDSTGTLETINNTDSFYSFIEFDITPEYAIGFLGKDTFEIGPEVSEISIFENISADNIDLEDIILKLEIINYIGAQAAVKINNFSMSNENNTLYPNLDQDGNSILGHTYLIENAILNNGTTNILPNNKEINVSVDEMIEILPNSIDFHAHIYTNPNAQCNTENFIFLENTVDASISLDVPLSLIASNLVLQDTSDLDINLDINEIENFEQIFVNVENGLPLSANLELILLDENDILLDTLLHNYFIAGAIPNTNNTHNSPTTTNTEISVTDFTNANKISIKADFNTLNNQNFIRIYDNDDIKITVSGRLKRRFGK